MKEHAKSLAKIPDVHLEVLSVKARVYLLLTVL